MTTITRHRVDIKPEKDLLLALSVSDSACQKLLPIINLKSLQSSYVSTVIKWIKEYYDRYKEAPGIHLKDLFNVHKSKLDADESKLIGNFLSLLSYEYEHTEDFNEQYLVDRSLGYVDERNLLWLADNIKTLASNGEREKARALIARNKNVIQSTTGWVNPFAPSEVDNAMNIQKDILFRFPGALGQLVGDFERGFLVGFLAPVKRGKTWLLLELAVLSLMNKLKVAFATLEMKKERMERRIYKMVMSSLAGKNRAAYPCFDCLNNQDNSCDMAERACDIGLLDEDGDKPKFSESIEYVPCTYCRDKYPDKYIAEQWYTVIDRPVFNSNNVKEFIRSFETTYMVDNFKLKCYPRFSANLSQIMADIDILEYTDGFIPDVIIIDYADILAPENQYGDTRRMLDETWMKLAGIAEEKKCLVVTVSQSTRKSWDKKNIQDKDVAEDYAKMAHIDIMMTMNQTMEEKEQGIMRIGVCANREGYFNQFRQVTILQQLGAGQPLLDSEFMGG